MQPLYHEKRRDARCNIQAPVIPGGSYSIPPVSLIMVWAAYRQRKLDWLALRVWLALWEIRCWNEARTKPNPSPRYNTSQITAALRSPKLTAQRLQAALSALKHANLVQFSPTTIWIATSIDDLHDPELHQLAAQMLSNIGHPNADRGLRIPRRMFVFLMASRRPRPVYAGVMLALLVRTMLTKRYSNYKGCCTAGWIALVFGGDPSTIKSARARLIADGWFVRLKTPQRVRQRYGEWVALVIGQPVENHHETEPPGRPKPAETEPPLKNQSLSYEIETNQSLRTGASQPVWHHLQSLDLRTPERRGRVYRAAITAGVIRPTEAQKLTFFAAIARARRVATRNPCGFMRRLVETPDYHRFISQRDEEEASRWLKPQRPKLDACPQTVSEPARDQQIVTHLKRRLSEAGFNARNLFALLMTTEDGKRLLTGWTQNRWDQASLPCSDTTREPPPRWLGDPQVNSQSDPGPAHFDSP